MQTLTHKKVNSFKLEYNVRAVNKKNTTKALFYVSFHKLQDTRITVIHFIAYTLSYTLS